MNKVLTNGQHDLPPLRNAKYCPIPFARLRRGKPIGAALASPDRGARMMLEALQNAFEDVVASAGEPNQDSFEPAEILTEETTDNPAATATPMDGRTSGADEGEHARRRPTGDAQGYSAQHRQCR